MKVRNGFVSNSSSSSFVIITTEENHKAAMKKLTKTEKFFVKKVVKRKTICGRKCVVFHELNTPGDSYPNLDDFEIPEEISKGCASPEDAFYEAIGTWQEEISKNKGACWEDSVEGN